MGSAGVTINVLVLYAVSRILPQYPDLNALFTGEAIEQYSDVHLGFAVDTPRGLIVPVIRDAHTLTLRDMAAESRRLAAACQDGSVQPDELSGGTFTVTNLGNLGVESFTPILNVPQVAILGVGGITLNCRVKMASAFVRHLNFKSSPGVARWLASCRRWRARVRSAAGREISRSQRIVHLTHRRYGGDVANRKRKS